MMGHRILGAVSLAVLLALPLGAQGPTRTVIPVYEGYLPNADGTHDLLFGYFNRSWEDQFDIPLGPANSIDPGGPDQGQPTHFFPRRNRFVFKVRVPADFGNKEVVWTLTTPDGTQKAYGTLKPGYAMDVNVIMANFGAGNELGFAPDMMGNKPPKLTIESGRSLTTKVNQPVTLSAVATDDGKPSVRSIRPSWLGEGRVAPLSATGLRLSWFKYRGAGRVEFDPPQTKVWEDTRDGTNSPWSVGWTTPAIPSGNRWVVRATFRDPGTYVLRALAHDGGLMDYGDVTIIVTS